MRDFVILTDSCCDLPAELAAELGADVLPLQLTLNGKEYRNFLDGREIGFEAFYETVRGGAMPTTSAVSVGDFEARMRSILESGRDILCLSFSSALSTTYQSAVIAAQDLSAEFPEGKILVVDSMTASLGQGLFVWLCARKKAEGADLETVHAYALEIRSRICAWFTVDDLNHLKRGGRVSATTAFVGSMLSIKPVLHVDNEGRLISVGKARGRRASLTMLVDEMEKRFIPSENDTVFLSHGGCREDAEAVAEEIRRRFGIQHFIIHYVGPVIGSHTGCGVVALFFVGKER